MSANCFYLPKEIESIITKKKTDMEMMGVMIVLESADLLILRNMKDSTHHFSIKSRNVTRTINDGSVKCEGDFRKALISRGRPCAIALIKAFFSNYVVSNEEDDADDDYMEDDIHIYLFQSASSIEEACKMENRSMAKLQELSSMHCHEVIFAQLFTVHMNKLWLTLDNIIDFIGNNQLGEAESCHV